MLWRASSLLGLLFLVPVAGCGSDEAGAARVGRQVYEGNCTACHHPDPARDGTLGPAVAGSSRELLEARVLRADYPPGYTPKRDTSQMAALPFLAPYIDALAAYLASAS